MRSKLDLNKKHNQIIFKALSNIQEIFEDRALTEVDRINFRGSASRIARMYNDIYWEKDQIIDEVLEGLTTTFPVVPSSDEPGIIVHGPIVLNSMCPHHFLPVRYHAYIGYIPKKHGLVLGTSKLDRIPIALSKRFVLQENLVADIADVLYDAKNIEWLTKSKQYNKEEKSNLLFSSEGSICTLIGIHTCEACRGVQQDARTMVTDRRGCFQNPILEEKFFQQVQIMDKVRPFGN